jgi:flavin reductase (DIM6/NTAB) family NADH-FMN oxidoreductase RutF
MKIIPKESPTALIQKLLLGTIGPRPIALASTMDKDGNPNLSPFSFFNAIGTNPAMLMFSPSRRIRDNSAKDTLENLRQVPEVVINVVSYSIVEQVNLASSDYPRDVNEFIKSGLTPVPSLHVRPFRVEESPVQYECRVVDIIETGQEGGSGNLVLAEILCIHADDGIFDEDGLVNPNKIQLVGRLGGELYCHAYGSSVFEVTKPVKPLGIGVDILPEEIRRSDYLSGNDLGKLGNSPNLSTPEEIEMAIKLPPVQIFFEKYHERPEKLRKELHFYAKNLLREGKVSEALAVLMIPIPGQII